MSSKYKNHIVTYTLIVLCIVVYLYSVIKYGVSMSSIEGIRMGGFNPLLVHYYHEYYRLITANFIHFGIVHIFCNISSLYNLGIIMESILKREKYLLVIVISMLSTTGFSYLLFILFGSGVNSVMGGISGVIFGLIGSLLALALLYKDIYQYLFKQILPSVLMTFLISITIPSISLVGHIGGMLGGFLTTLVIEKNERVLH